MLHDLQSPAHTYRTVRRKTLAINCSSSQLGARLLLFLFLLEAVSVCVALDPCATTRVCRRTLPGLLPALPGRGFSPPGAMNQRRGQQLDGAREPGDLRFYAPLLGPSALSVPVGLPSHRKRPAKLYPPKKGKRTNGLFALIRRRATA